ncbi:MAG: hypothetical protein IJF76_02000 [Clostridia bacterium]|nr:hypothetical protein [Clostridia bacterium]
MNVYEKPQIVVIALLQNESIADAPWGSFADDLEQLGGSITSYEYGSGVLL